MESADGMKQLTQCVQDIKVASETIRDAALSMEYSAGVLLQLLSKGDATLADENKSGEA